MTFETFLNFKLFSLDFINLFTKNSLDLHFNFYYLNNLENIKKNFLNNKNILANIKNSYGELYFISCQIYNHYFFFNSISKKQQKFPNDFILSNINKYFSSFDNFKNIFFNLFDINHSISFIWLCRNEYGELCLHKSLSLENPIRFGLIPILCLDTCEHSYFFDYFYDYKKYFDFFFNNINWEFMEKNLLL